MLDSSCCNTSESLLKSLWMSHIYRLHDISIWNDENGKIVYLPSSAGAESGPDLQCFFACYPESLLELNGAVLQKTVKLTLDELSGSLVHEVLIQIPHNSEQGYLLPSLEPTGASFTALFIFSVSYNSDRTLREVRVLWDQASVLKQLNVFTTISRFKTSVIASMLERLPIVGKEVWSNNAAYNFLKPLKKTSEGTEKSTSPQITMRNFRDSSELSFLIKNGDSFEYSTVPTNSPNSIHHTPGKSPSVFKSTIQSVLKQGEEEQQNQQPRNNNRKPPQQNINNNIFFDEEELEREDQRKQSRKPSEKSHRLSNVFFSSNDEECSNNPPKAFKDNIFNVDILPYVPNISIDPKRYQDNQIFSADDVNVNITNEKSQEFDPNRFQSNIQFSFEEEGESLINDQLNSLSLNTDEEPRHISNVFVTCASVSDDDVSKTLKNARKIDSTSSSKSVNKSNWSFHEETTAPNPNSKNSSRAYDLAYKSSIVFN